MYANSKESKDSMLTGDYLNISNFVNKNSSVSILWTDGKEERNERNNKDNSILSNAPSAGNYWDSLSNGDGSKSVYNQMNSNKCKPISSKTSKLESNLQVNNFNLNYSNKSNYSKV